MGARLSQPRGPAGTTESSLPAPSPAPPTPKNPFPRTINGRTIVGPVAALTMAGLLFVYARTSIRAAKANAQRHRDADSGGEGLSLLQESRRRHGLEKRIDRGGGTVSQLASEAKAQLLGGSSDGNGKAGGAEAVAVDSRKGLSEEDERLRALKSSARRAGGG